MSPSITLISLACAIANSGSIDTSSITAQLTQAEQAQAAQIVASGACLPERMERLLEVTREQLRDGSLDPDGRMSRHAPSELCSMIER